MPRVAHQARATLDRQVGVEARQARQATGDGARRQPRPGIRQPDHPARPGCPLGGHEAHDIGRADPLGLLARSAGQGRNT